MHALIGAFHLSTWCIGFLLPAFLSCVRPPESLDPMRLSLLLVTCCYYSGMHLYLGICCCSWARFVRHELEICGVELKSESDVDKCMQQANACSGLHAPVMTFFVHFSFSSFQLPKKVMTIEKRGERFSALWHPIRQTGPERRQLEKGARFSAVYTRLYLATTQLDLRICE